jgi:hypothetical protein
MISKKEYLRRCKIRDRNQLNVVIVSGSVSFIIMMFAIAPAMSAETVEQLLSKIDIGILTGGMAITMLLSLAWGMTTMDSGLIAYELKNRVVE